VCTKVSVASPLPPFIEREERVFRRGTTDGFAHPAQAKPPQVSPARTGSESLEQTPRAREDPARARPGRAPRRAPSCAGDVLVRVGTRDGCSDPAALHAHGASQPQGTTRAGGTGRRRVQRRDEPAHGHAEGEIEREGAEVIPETFLSDSGSFADSMRAREADSLRTHQLAGEPRS